MFFRILLYIGFFFCALPYVSHADCLQYYKNEVYRIQKSHDAESGKLTRLEKSKRSVKLAQFESSAELTGATTAGFAAISGPAAPVGAFVGLWGGIESSWMMWDRAGLQARKFNQKVDDEEKNVRSLEDSADLAIHQTELFHDAIWKQPYLTNLVNMFMHSITKTKNSSKKLTSQFLC